MTYDMTTHILCHILGDTDKLTSDITITEEKLWQATNFEAP